METKIIKTTAKEFNVLAKEFNAENDGVKENIPVLNLKSEHLERELYDSLEEYCEKGDLSKEGEKVWKWLKKEYAVKEPEVKLKTKKKVKGEVVVEPEPEPEVKLKTKKAKAVEIGDTVELEVESDEIKVEKKMKKEKGGANPQVDAARIAMQMKVTKDELLEIINGDLFEKKVKKALLKETNFLRLRKLVREALDADAIAQATTELASVPKVATEKKVAEKAPKAAKESPLINSIKSAIKVKQLKRIAKENDMFNWKVLKVLDFDEMQTAMLSGAAPEQAPAKVKMVANPLIAEIEGFKKAKKLVKWAKEQEVGYQKSMKKLALAELQEALIAAIPAEIEVVKGKSKTKAERGENLAPARKAFIIPLIKEGKYTRKELLNMLDDKFGADDPHGSHPHNNMLSEIKNEKYYTKHGLGELVIENADGCYVFASAVKPAKKVKEVEVETKKEKKGKKDKKNKKNKKGNK